jgi:type IV pilus assembly protein PilC
MKVKYQGVARAGKRVEGELDVQSVDDAKAQLRNMQIRPLKLVKVNEKKAGASSGFDLQSLLGNSGKPTLIEFTAFIRQLATMQGAGIPIVQSLSVLAEQSENKAFGSVLNQVRSQIEQGATLADALRKHPKVFDRIFLNLIAAGEISGALDKVLLRLAVYYEKAASLKRKIVSALTYPVLILVIVIVVVIVLLTLVVPTFASMFASSGKPLPAATQVILNLSNFIRSNFLFLGLGFGGVLFGIYYAFTNEGTRRVIDPLLIEIPVFGNLIKKISISRFSRTLATMIQSGVPILDALEITANVAGNYAVEDTVKRVRQSITEGNSIAGPLSKASVFPKMAVSMIAIGEQTGSLEQMLIKIAEFYEDEVDAAVSSLTSILEPLMIVIVGLVVAGVLIPMYLPIFSMGDTLSGGQ